MNRNLRPLALVATALLVVGIVENALFGADSGGARHYISVGFFLLSVASLLCLIVVGIMALVRRTSNGRA